MIFTERHATDTEFLFFILESKGISLDSIEITEDPDRKIQFVEFLYRGLRYKMPNHLKVTELAFSGQQKNNSDMKG